MSPPVSPRFTARRGYLSPHGQRWSQGLRSPPRCSLAQITNCRAALTRTRRPCSPSHRGGSYPEPSLQQDVPVPREMRSSPRSGSRGRRSGSASPQRTPPAGWGNPSWPLPRGCKSEQGLQGDGRGWRVLSGARRSPRLRSPGHGANPAASAAEPAAGLGAAAVFCGRFPG